MRCYVVIIAVLLGGCGAPDASTLTHPPRKFAFPLYISVPGTTLGEGKIYKVPDSGSDANVSSELEVLLEGLNFPTGLVVDTDGTIYFTEMPTPETGRILTLGSGDTTATELASGFSRPEGITIDRASRLYVTEMDLNRVSKISVGSGFDIIHQELTAPRTVATDESDNLLITEPSIGRVSKVIPDGTREDLVTDLVNPLFAGPGLVGNTFVLENNVGLGDGRAILVPIDGGSPSDFLGSLINPKSFAWEDGTILYVAEGAPVNRVTKYSTVSSLRTTLVDIPGDPHTIAFTPID